MGKLLLTRYSVRTNFSWDAFPAEWLESRLELFHRYCLPSVAGQTDGDFRWAVMCDEITDPAHVAALRDCRADCPQLEVVMTDGPREIVGRARALAAEDEGDFVVTVRLDSDDAIDRDFMATVEDYAPAFREAAHPRWLLNFPLGFKRHVVEDVTVRAQLPNSPFHALFERGPRPHTVLSGNHTTFHTEMPVHQDLSLHAWLQVLHGGNIRNRVKASDTTVEGVDLAARFGVRLDGAVAYFDRLPDRAGTRQADEIERVATPAGEPPADPAPAAPAPAAADSVAAFRAAREEVPFHDYEVVFPIDRPDPGRARMADQVEREGWRHGDRPPISLVPPVDWENAAASERAWQFYLHAWYGLSPVLGAYQHAHEERHLRFALDLALDWIGSFPDTSADSEWAWYDMSTGQRAYRLAFIADAALRTGLADDAQAAALRASLVEHLRVFADDARFAEHSNHGFYFAAGQSAIARRFPELPGAAEAAGMAADRIKRLLAHHFTAEGVHMEHSPEYHQMMLATLRGLVDAGLVHDPEAVARTRGFEEALSWLILPNKRLTMFGDSPHRALSWRGTEANMDPALLYLANDGEAGRLPDARLRTFPESGYAVVRVPDAEDFTLSSQLAFNCAYHSRTHKHADDLSFVWYDRGAELLVDPGRFGYEGKSAEGSELLEAGFWYSDPRRVYVESTGAHNALEIDGHSYNRRRERPYGSALRRTWEGDGLYALEGDVRHAETIRHSRVLVLAPGEWLLVFDWLLDAAEAPHRYTQRFQLAPELDAARGGGIVRATTAAGLDLGVLALDGRAPAELVRGQEEPELRGWISRRDGELEPCWSLAYAEEDVPGAMFSTLFRLGPGPLEVLDEPVIARSGQQARWAWRDHTGEHRVQLQRRRGEEMSVVDLRSGR